MTKEELSRRAKQLKTDVPAVILAVKEKQTPWYAKLVAGLIVAYALSPIDLIPDFIPVIGALDDLIILPALIVLFVKLIPPEVMANCRKQAEELHADPKSRWYYALPFVIIWALLLFIIIKAFIKK